MASEKEASAGANDFALTPTNELPPSGKTISNNSEEDEYIEPRMTKAKWLACIALGISYTTAFQQGATLGAIIKSIDQVLGMLMDK